MEKLHLISNSNVPSSVVDKLQNMFKEKFFNEIANSSKLIIYNTSKRNLGKKSTFMRLNTTNIDQQLQNSESRLIHFQWKVEDGMKLHVGNACVIYVFQMT